MLIFESKQIKFERDLKISLSWQCHINDLSINLNSMVDHNGPSNNKNIKKISQIKKLYSNIKKICFHINKICFYTKKGFPYKQKKPHSKQPRQIWMANSCSKFSLQIALANFCPNSHSKFLQQIFTANSCSKQLSQSAAAKSHGKVLWQISTANS